MHVVLVWKGMGPIVPGAFFGAAVPLFLAEQAIHPGAVISGLMVGPVAGLLTALACWLCVRKNEPLQERRDRETGETWSFRESAGEFMFVTIRQWIWMAPMLGALLGGIVYSERHDAEGLALTSPTAVYAPATA